ncbi:NAD-dependent epimerase/dehydratase family protein [Aquimarina algiphila]|uniref:NAD-dependent epimerase/dehydratase family protein n=1 Tax=Aquimarina algiphila TaxID=2047982 RepID=UPI002492E955|nr:NAD-dependent epimerase/dehydratase family protein [Aquimarina algiphila]
MKIDNSKLKRNIFIVGASSKLSQSIKEKYVNHNIIDIYRETYTYWIGVDAQELIHDFFEKEISENSIIFIPAAILNPNIPNEQILKINYDLPLNIIEALKKYNARIVTFGTIFEKMGSSNNNYVNSKIKLSSRIEELVQDKHRITHFRLHTLYGKDYPNEFMFLGQIFSAIKNKTEFQMTSGEQIREYHHYDDVTASVYDLLIKDINGVFEMTYGNGMKLKYLATKIFSFFEMDQLLKIGLKNIDYKDKFQNDYLKNDDLNTASFREPINGITEYLKQII